MLATTRTPASRGSAVAVSTMEPNTHGRHTIVMNGGSPKPFMWARPTSSVGSERPSSRHPVASSNEVLVSGSPLSDVRGIPRPPPSATFAARPAARQKPLSMSLDLFDLRRPSQQASRGGSRHHNASALPVAAADDFGEPYATPRTQSVEIPVIVEDSWGDLAGLPPVNRTVQPVTSARRNRGQAATQSSQVVGLPSASSPTAMTTQQQPAHHSRQQRTAH